MKEVRLKSPARISLFWHQHLLSVWKENVDLDANPRWLLRSHGPTELSRHAIRIPRARACRPTACHNKWPGRTSTAALPSSFWRRRLQSYIEIRPGPALSVSHESALSAHTMGARDNRPSDICLYELCVAGLYHVERNHQGKDNVLLFPTAAKAMNRVDRSVICKERLGGLLKFYHREAA